MDTNRSDELINTNKELNQSAELLQEKLKELSYYKHALDESSIIAITDQKGIIKKVNSNFCKITKYREEELIGQDHRIINSGHHSKEFIRDLWVTIANGKIWKGEFKNKAKDGSFYWVDTTIVPFLDGQGKPYQYLAIRVDITGRKEAEEYLIQRTAQLETANEELAFQIEENEKRAAELIIANKLAIQNEEKEKRAAELVILNKELAFQIEENEKRAAELIIANKDKEDQNWLLKGRAILDDSIRGDQSISSLSQKIINQVSKYVDAHVAAIYISDDTNGTLRLSGSYAFRFSNGNNNIIKLGEGMVGQAALDKNRIVFTDVPSNYVKVCSALGDVTPHTILVQPFLYNGNVAGVIEFGFVTELSQLKMDFITMVLDSLGVAIYTAQARLQLNNLLEKTQQQAEELETQKEEIQTINESLMAKTYTLQASEEELKVQQEELRHMNAELEEKAEQLEEKNKSIEQTHEAIRLKALELERASQYKSEFLANMSHELRTPLNSILILARILNDNKVGNLSEEQLKYSEVIYNAGSDLLELINDILDLSKIESGKIDLSIEDVKVDSVKTDLELLFNEVANKKKIDFQVRVEKTVPEIIITDRMRLQQILKNLLSNAFKFTPQNGSVSVNISLANGNTQYNTENLRLVQGKEVLQFEVKDSGIGIPPEKQKLIFEAFQQAENMVEQV